MTNAHNLIDPNDPADRDKAVHRVVIDVVAEPGQDDPKTWDWDSLIDGRSALVSSTLIHGALNGEVQRLLDLAVGLDRDLTELLEPGNPTQHVARIGIELHWKLTKLGDEAIALAAADPSADVSGLLDLITTSTDRLLVEVFQIDPKVVKP